MSQVDRKTLRQLLTTHFNLSELRNLCFDLSIDYENFGGEGKEDKVRSLIEYAERHGRMEDVVAQCRALRPHANWKGSELGAEASPSPPTNQKGVNPFLSAILKGMLSPLDQETIESPPKATPSPQANQETVEPTSVNIDNAQPLESIPAFDTNKLTQDKIINQQQRLRYLRSLLEQSVKRKRHPDLTVLNKMFSESEDSIRKEIAYIKTLLRANDIVVADEPDD